MSYTDRELLLIGVDGCISALHVQAKGDLFQEGAIKLVEATRDYIASLSTADVVEVVRCQNCKYRIYKDMGDDIGMIGGCKVWGVALPGDFYCAHSARMDKEDEHEAD